jgi:hypothetical protein
VGHVELTRDTSSFTAALWELAGIHWHVARVGPLHGAG